MKEISLKIDGVPVRLSKGSTILEAAKKAGIFIPCLCNHPDLSPIGLCRLSVVEVEGRPAFPLASVTLAEDGMVVRTITPELQEMRRASLEMILALMNHPTECLFCDEKDKCESIEKCLKGYSIAAGCKNCPSDGECEIQEAVAYTGLSKVRFKTKYRDLPVLREPFLNRDYNLCILCSRCVRVCSEVRGEDVIVYHPQNHKDHWVGPKETPLLVESDCKFCGACVDACPTGALTARFEQSKKPDNFIRTTCPNCGVGCQIEVGVKDNEIVKVRGVRGGTVNEGQLCVKGRFGLLYAMSPERLKKPLIRRGGELKPASWDEAIEYVSSKFNELKEKYGSDALAGIASSKTTNEECYLFQKFMRVCLGTNNVEFCTRFCHAVSGVALTRSLGAGAMTNSTREIDKSDVVLVVGFNATENSVIFGSYLRNMARTNGLKVIVVDPRRIDLVKDASLWLRPKLGTDLALLNGMMNVVINEGLVDTEFVQNQTEGYDELSRVVAQYTPEKAEEITGVPAEQIKEAARLYAKARRASIVYGMGVAQYTNGTNNISALCNLALLTGNVGKEGTGVNTVGKQNNGHGAGDMGCLCAIYPGGQPVSDPKVNEKFEKAWGVKLSTKPGITETDMVFDEDKIKGMYIMGGNPVASGPDAKRIKRNLKSKDFLVVQDIFLTQTAEIADVVLPAACLLEKDGTVTSTERRVNRVRKILDPPGEARTDWEIICAIATKMGYGKQFTYAHPSEITDEIARLTPPYGGISFERLEQGGIHVPCPAKDHPGTPYLYKNGFPKGKAKFFPAEYQQPAELPDKEFPFVLSTVSSIYHMRTGTTIEKIHDMSKISGHELVRINPEDARALDVKDNDLVEISSRRGRVNVKSKITDEVPKGVVVTTFHFPETPINVLTNWAYDPFGKVPELKYCAVKVRKVA